MIPYGYEVGCGEPGGAGPAVGGGMGVGVGVGVGVSVGVGVGVAGVSGVVPICRMPRVDANVAAVSISVPNAKVTVRTSLDRTSRPSTTRAVMQATTPVVSAP